MSTRLICQHTPIPENEAAHVPFPTRRSFSDEVLCGDDSKDWWINDPNEALGPSGKRSTLAWTGTGKANDRNQDVRFCLTAIDNKHPDRLVSTIDHVSSKKQAAGVILAITFARHEPRRSITTERDDCNFRKSWSFMARDGHL